jgi:outer membrane murein-binding lipoprotein Lpp
MHDVQDVCYFVVVAAAVVAVALLRGCINIIHAMKNSIF